MSKNGKDLGNGKSSREKHLEDLKGTSRALAKEYSEALDKLDDEEVNKHRAPKRRKTDK